jgi:epsin
MGGGAPMVPTPMRTNTTSHQASTTTTSTTTKTGGGFDDLWNLSLASTGKAAPSSGGDAQGKSMRDLQKEKSTAGLWGAGGGGRGFGSGTGGASGGGGGDDLLL